MLDLLLLELLSLAEVVQLRSVQFLQALFFLEVRVECGELRPDGADHFHLLEEHVV